MAFRLGSDSHDEILADINVTPLVDVMLVLLIIFMVTAPMLHQGVEVALPQAQAQSLPLHNPDPMVITVTKDELVYIKDTPVHRSLLIERLTPIMENRDDKSVFLKADKDVPYGAFMAVVEILSAAGTYRIGLVTEPAPRSRRRR